MEEKEIQEAKNWLGAEATNKKIILNYIDKLEFKLLAKERGIEEANVLIEQLQEENQKLKNDNQVLRETLWEEDKLGGNVSE